ncbi:hypothetical protein WG66_000767 [Moniliophthora roreri]|nr:hypothetical protein WG66_000767 [Moniliophthora roreri]
MASVAGIVSLGTESQVADLEKKEPMRANGLSLKLVGGDCLIQEDVYMEGDIDNSLAMNTGISR